jgi:hypothetical protein
VLIDHAGHPCPARRTRGGRWLRSTRRCALELVDQQRANLRIGQPRQKVAHRFLRDRFRQRRHVGGTLRGSNAANGKRRSSAHHREQCDGRSACAYSIEHTSPL